MVEINPFSALSSIGQAAIDRRTIAENFEAFLGLLTTQLRNQNPLDPLDTNQFTQQLVQFTEVEQSLKMNENLETLAKLAAATTITNAVNYIGKEITASGSTAILSDGAAAWQVDIAESSPATTFIVTDSIGRQVYAETRAAPGGKSLFTWDGRKTDGTTAANGSYSLTVKALDAQGNLIETSTSFKGLVDGVDMSGSEPVLTAGGREVRLDEIVAITIP